MRYDDEQRATLFVLEREFPLMYRKLKKIIIHENSRSTHPRPLADKKLSHVVPVVINQ